MFHMIFESPRHYQDIYAYRRRSRGPMKSSTHNQLELETIRGSIKGRWDVQGFGSAAFQSKVWSVESSMAMTAPERRLHTHLNGHIITVEAAADAIWFRLNHEHVSKNGCKLVAIYKDLDTEWIINKANEANKFFTAANNRRNLDWNMSNAESSLRKYVEADHDRVEGLDDVAEQVYAMIRKITDASTTETDRLRNEGRRLAAELFNYLKEHSSEIPRS